MLGFLQGFSYGLFLSCLPWFVVGMVEPRLAVPSEPPTRWRAVVRYWVGVPFVAFALWLTSLWGGFSPSFDGWLAGLGALMVAIPVERWWHRQTRDRLKARRAAVASAKAEDEHARRQAAAYEKGVIVLDPARPPKDADRVTLALCQSKRRLLDDERADLAAQADRLYSRYVRVLDILSQKFDPRELTFDRSRAMVEEVGLAAAENLSAMATLTASVAGIDAAFVRRRLYARKPRPSADERDALERRLDLVADTERRLTDLSARNEATLTTFDDAIVVMSRIDTQRPDVASAADDALADLQQFLNRAERYGRQT